MDSPWLQGPFAPVDDERDDLDLRVTGTLPPGLRGAFLRNGPNPRFAPLGRYHLFDGDGMVHGVTFDGEGGARYANRWVRGAGFEAEVAAGRALYGGLSEYRLPPDDVFATAGPVKNTANTHVVRHAGHVLALMEGCPPIELRPDLSTVGTFDFDGALRGSMTAHPKVDPATGEMVFFGYSPIAPFLRVHAADADGTLTWSTVVELPGAVMMHDFAVTATKVVIFDLPAVFDLDAMLSGGAGIRWDPDRVCRVGVLDRGAPGDTIRWIETDPFWVFHFLNAHDADDGGVVVTGCRAERLTTSFGDDDPEARVRPNLHRWHVDADAGKVLDEPLDDRPTDFPRVADAVAGLPHRYGYTSRSRRWEDGTATFDGILKYDLATGEVAEHVYGDVVSGEVVPVADPDDPSEDAGWLLTFVHDLAADESSVVVSDAATLSDVARVHIPRRVPFGFHGSFLPDPV